jgi:imidazolonepropionase-like amidohydrolase
VNLVIRGDVFDGEECLGRGAVVIDQAAGTITNVGRDGEVDFPRGAKAIGGEGFTVIPGLIDAHVHFFGSKAYDLGAWVSVPEPMVALRSVPQLTSILAAGFTAVREMGSKGGAQIAKAVREGSIDGPTVLSCGRSLGQTGGDDDPTNLPLDVAQRLSYSYFGDGPWEMRRAVRMAIRDGADFIKVYTATGSTVEPFDSPFFHLRQQLTVEELKAVVDEAHRVGVKVAAHAIGEESMANVVEAGVDSIEHGIALTPEVAAQIKKKRIYYVPTLGVFVTNPTLNAMINDPAAPDPVLARRHAKFDMKLAKEAELEVVCGTDFGGTDEQPHGKNHVEIAVLAETLGNKEALISATSRAARCLGMERSGRIIQGFAADIVLVKGDPLDDIRALRPEGIAAVVKGGKLFRGG